MSQDLDFSKKKIQQVSKEKKADVVFNWKNNLEIVGVVWLKEY
jgi:hypothetical protein